MATDNTKTKAFNKYFTLSIHVALFTYHTIRGTVAPHLYCNIMHIYIYIYIYIYIFNFPHHMSEAKVQLSYVYKRILNHAAAIFE